MKRPVYDSQNIFARILRGEIPNKTVFENEHVLAFHDINPQAPVHILVIPKGAYVAIHDFGAYGSAEEIKSFYQAIDVIVEQENLQEAGFRCIANVGVNGGQEVPHFHMHILGGRKIGPMVSRSAE